MKITTDQLLEITRLLLEMIEKQRKTKEIEFKESDYLKIWHKDIERNLDPDQEPLQSLGDANDDIERMLHLLNVERDSMFSYDLERLGAILIQIGATLR